VLHIYIYIYIYMTLVALGLTLSYLVDTHKAFHTYLMQTTNRVSSYLS